MLRTFSLQGEEQHSSSSKDINDDSIMREQQAAASGSHQGTPNDVRLLFPMMTMRPRRDSCPATLLAGSSVSSPSIPIAPAELSESEMQLEDDEAKAQFREHAMYQRIFYSMRENKNKAAAATIPTTTSQEASSLPFFPVLPHDISLHNQAAHMYRHHYDAHHAAPLKVQQPLPPSSVAALPILHDHHSMMIGREFSFAISNKNNHSPTSSSSSCCDDDEDFVFEMDDM
jgi:hypothetical protein